MQAFDGIGGARRAPLAGGQAGEGEQPVTRFLQTVGDRPALEPPLAQEGLATTSFPAIGDRPGNGRVRSTHGGWALRNRRGFASVIEPYALPIDYATPAHPDA